MDGILEVIKARYSVRSYLDKPVEKGKLERVIEAARLAPSAKNLQEWRLVVVTDKETRKRLSVAAANQGFVAEAPVVIACCAETDGHTMMCGQQCYPIDLAIAIDHMTLQAVKEGLGTCWIGAFDEKEAKKILGIPRDIRVVELLPLGYPAGSPPSSKSRLKTREMACAERWTF